MSFTQKYAPTKLADVIIASQTVQSKLADYIAGNRLQPIILHGQYGTGKSSICRLLPSAMEGKDAVATELKTTEFSSVHDVAKVFDAPPLFYKLFSTNHQKRHYIISNEFNFTTKAAIAFRDVIDELYEHTQFIFTTNDLNSIDAGLRDRSTCLHIPPASASHWLARAQFILNLEGICLPDAQVLNVLNTQLQVSNSNRKLLECLEDLVQMVRNGGGIKEANVEPAPLTPVPPPPIQYNPLAALPA
jgi:replication-associated recombination protein RarA